MTIRYIRNEESKPNSLWGQWNHFGVERHNVVLFGEWQLTSDFNPANSLNFNFQTFSSHNNVPAFESAMFDDILEESRTKRTVGIVVMDDRIPILDL